MASTYSALKIQLMATGENSGTWGSVTNVNLGTALEEAIVGSETVLFSGADLTLTLTNTNASQTARNLRLNLTGPTGAARSLIVPAIEKVYIINNACTDTITVKNSTGSGIAVPAGKTMYVYNTSTDVVDAITHLTSLTLASALPVASGGTGSTTATFSGANITNLNANNIASGTLNNARTSASSSNGASTIVSRDASGNFSAGTITASLSGTASTANALNTGNNYQVNSLGVGTGASGTAGEIRATNNVTAYYSDDRLKTKLGAIEDALSKVKSLSGFYYEANETAQALGYEVKREVGVSAQEVQLVQPEVVAPAPIDDKYLTVRYERLVPLLIEAIKELSEKVEKLRG